MLITIFLLCAITMLSLLIRFEGLTTLLLLIYVLVTFLWIALYG